LLAGWFRSTTHSGTPSGTIFINFVITFFIGIVITVDFINCGR
jgi:fluoride ion exporter CrcB/FEX